MSFVHEHFVNSELFKRNNIVLIVKLKLFEPCLKILERFFHLLYREFCAVIVVKFVNSEAQIVDLFLNNFFLPFFGQRNFRDLRMPNNYRIEIAC